MLLLRFPLFFSWLLLLCVSLIGGSEASLPSRDLLGISPQDETYYKGLSSGAAIKCKNGSNKFTPAQLNDDFCDCPDGSDEPGTSACPNGKFYCRNAGHMPLLINSSMVNDGICDCCDGSDEYGGKTKCPDMCWEVGKVTRDKLKKRIAIFQEGVIIRKQEVEQAKLAILKEEAELAKLTKEEKILKDIVEQLKEHKEQIEEAEEKERMQREKEKEKKEADEAKLEVTKTGENYLEEAENAKDGIHSKIPSEDAPALENVVEDHSSKVDKVDKSDISIMDETPGDDVGRVIEDSPKHAMIEEGSSASENKADLRSSEVKDATENTESLSREELGRVVGSRWTGKKAEQETGEAKANKDDHGDHDEEYNMYDSEADTEDQMDEEDHDSSSSSLLSDDDTDDHGDDFEGEDHDSSSSSDDELDLSEAARVRKEYNGSTAKWTKIQSRISKLTRKLKRDFGPEKEFYSFHGQCFEIKQNKYTYKICPFKKATQVDEYSTTYLGNWDKFEDSYRTMQFSNGDNCWNGPDRSLKVKLRCGLKNEVNSVDEPSRCEYLAVLSTPALCSEEKLKELEDKLKMLDRELPQGTQGHDEL
ncbi:PREDICTED: glucosidase 2 subunit beta-like isoform X2 [Ipomoea nil]|uniref:glucosidase 2 subunit beta-like isoform X2 n=1 Tax=Ipomoea nil TaxID=35883 RepID=UPI0009017CCD|nr:PREDICTED: glucosidase 2 subunit beta-like isoform X2 [Ipomoea nil]